MDWSAIFTGIIAIVTLFIPVLLLWMNAKIEAAKVAAARAAQAANTAAAVVDTVKEGVESNTKMLDGRLTEFFKLNDDRQRASEKAVEALRAANEKTFGELRATIDSAFERGRVVGGEEMTNTVLTQGQDDIKAHLDEQDRVAEKRHEEVKNGPEKK
jgi:hypothetical protein